MSNINSSINLAPHLKLPLFASEQVIHLAKKMAILGWDPSTKHQWTHKTSVLHGFFGRNICKRRPWPITRMFQVAIMTDHFAINAMAGCMMCLRFQIPKNIFNFKRSMTRIFHCSICIWVIYLRDYMSSNCGHLSQLHLPPRITKCSTKAAMGQWTGQWFWAWKQWPSNIAHYLDSILIQQHNVLNTLPGLQIY